MTDDTHTHTHTDSDADTDTDTETANRTGHDQHSVDLRSEASRDADTHDRDAPPADEVPADAQAALEQQAADVADELGIDIEQAMQHVTQADQTTDDPAVDAHPAAPAAKAETTHTDSDTAANGAGSEEYDARGEAKRLITAHEQEGLSRADAIEQAAGEVQNHLQQLGQRLQQLRQQEQRTENRVEDLRTAKAHLRRLPDAEWAARTLGGGISVAVPPADEYGSAEDDDRVPEPDPATVTDQEASLVDWEGVYDRADLVRDVNDTLADAERSLAETREEQGKLERGIGNAQEIQRELEDAREWVGAGAGGHQNGGGGGTGGGGRADRPTSYSME